MVDFTKFKSFDNLMILESGIYVIIGNKVRDYYHYEFNNYNFSLSIRNNDGELVKMGDIKEENSLQTIIKLIEYHNGEFLPNNILQ